MKVTRRTGSLVIVLVIFAAIVLGTALAAIAIDKSEIPMLQQHAAEAAARLTTKQPHKSFIMRFTQKIIMIPPRAIML